MNVSIALVVAAIVLAAACPADAQPRPVDISTQMPRNIGFRLTWHF